MILPSCLTDAPLRFMRRPGLADGAGAPCGYLDGLCVEANPAGPSLHAGVRLVLPITAEAAGLSLVERVCLVPTTAIRRLAGRTG